MIASQDELVAFEKRTKAARLVEAKMKNVDAENPSEAIRRFTPSYAKMAAMALMSEFNGGEFVLYEDHIAVVNMLKKLHQKTVGDSQ